jgi:predicted nucleotidyltransferase component of viral defense system
MKLHIETVSSLLWESLEKLMAHDGLKEFRLVGGTALSLQCGHRISIDIDLFTDSPYNSVDFYQIDHWIKETFDYAEMSTEGNIGFGKSYYVGLDSANLVKLDFYYTDQFVFPELISGQLRMASKEEIAAMKLEVIGRGGRKKDFWDVHELLDSMSIHDMLSYYEKRYPYGHMKENLIQSLTKFDSADDDFDPDCLRQKHWELIKLDFEELAVTEF